jgi:hypothetical protein
MGSHPGFCSGTEGFDRITSIRLVVHVDWLTAPRVGMVVRMNDLAECAVVLTAGYGSRLFPVTAVVQKSLMPVLNLPVLH